MINVAVDGILSKNKEENTQFLRTFLEKTNSTA